MVVFMPDIAVQILNMKKKTTYEQNAQKFGSICVYNKF